MTSVYSHNFSVQWLEKCIRRGILIFMASNKSAKFKVRPGGWRALTSMNLKLLIEKNDNLSLFSYLKKLEILNAYNMVWFYQKDI